MEPPRAGTTSDRLRSMVAEDVRSDPDYFDYEALKASGRIQPPTLGPPQDNRMPDAPPGVEPVMQPRQIPIPGTPGPIVIKDAPQALSVGESLARNRDAIPFLGLANRGIDNELVGYAIELYKDARAGRVNPGKSYGPFDPTNTEHWDAATQIVRQWATEQLRPTTIQSDIATGVMNLPAMAAEFSLPGMAVSIPMRGAVEAQQRQMPSVSRDPKTGEVTLTPADESPEESQLKGLGSAVIEAVTERLGLGVAKKVVGPAVAKIPKLNKAVEGIANGIRRLVQDEGARALLRAPAKALDKSGKVIQDPISEYLEEYAAANLRAAFDIDDYGLEGDKNTLANRLAKSIVPDLRTMAVTMAVSSVPMAARGGLALASRGRTAPIQEAIAKDPVLSEKAARGEPISRGDLAKAGITEKTSQADRDAAAEAVRSALLAEPARQAGVTVDAAPTPDLLGLARGSEPVEARSVPEAGQGRVEPSGANLATETAVERPSFDQFVEQKVADMKAAAAKKGLRLKEAKLEAIREQARKEYEQLYGGNEQATELPSQAPAQPVTASVDTSKIEQEQGGDGKARPPVSVEVAAEEPGPDATTFALNREHIEATVRPERLTSPERIESAENLKEAISLGYHEPAKAVSLVETANANNRPLNRVEVAGVRTAAVTLKGQLKQAYKEIGDMPDGPAKDIRMNDVAKLQNQLDDLLIPALRAGSEWGRTGVEMQMIQQLAAVDSLPEFLTRMRIKKGREATAKETAAYKKLFDEYEALKVEHEKVVAELNKKTATELLFKKKPKKMRQMDPKARQERMNELARKAIELLGAGCDPS